MAKTASPVKTIRFPADPRVLMHVSPAKLVMTEQVRTEVDDKADAELLESIKALGVLQPVLVRQVNDELHVIAGHRRTRMSIEAELGTIPVLVSKDVDDAMVVAQQLVENLQRSDMTLLDTADGVWTLYNGAAGGSARVVGEMLGKTKSWVSKSLLLSAPGKAHAVARKLMAADKLYDIELAYLICQVEAISRDAADVIADNIENETRSTVKAQLAVLKRGNFDAGDDEGSDEGNDEGECDNGSDEGTGEEQDAARLEVLTFLQRITTEATVQASDMEVKRKALAMIAQAIQKAN